FFQCQEVSDVVSLLAAVLDPEDGVALAAALRSPLFALDDDTLWRLTWPPGADRPSLPRRFRAAEEFADLPEQAALLGGVPDLGRGPKLDNRMPALDDALGVVGGPIDASGRVVTGHLGLEEHRRKELDRERAEQARLFYVACTRAEDVLVLLEGKGDARYLREEKGERHVWCHQVWDVLERARVATFVVSGAPEET